LGRWLPNKVLGNDNAFELAAVHTRFHCHVPVLHRKVSQGGNPQWRVHDDAIEHHFRNVRGAAGDNTSPAAQKCCAATRHATIIRLFRDTAGYSGGSPDNADDNDDEYRSFGTPEQVPGISKRESLFAFKCKKRAASLSLRVLVLVLSSAYARGAVSNYDSHL